MQYHEVKINLELREARDCYWAGAYTSSWATDMAAATVGSLASCSLYVDYIFLDTEERRRFAQLSHEYLIEQLQFTGDESTNTVSNKVKLNFNHPTKFLAFVVQPDDYTTSSTVITAAKGKQWFNFTDASESGSADTVAAGAAGGAAALHQSALFGSGENPVKLAKLQLNGHDRFSERDGRYFNLVQPYQHFENVPAKGINVYSFALKPTDHQPSGTCNMSRIDNAVLQLTLTNDTVKDGSNTRSAKIKVFAVNYNVLRVMSGMGGINFCN